MRLVVTRVQPQAQQWVQALCDHGHDALALPLIETRGLPDASRLRRGWAQLARYKAVRKVSAHAVQHFFQEKPALAPISKGFEATKTRAWGTGPGTRNALLAQGFPLQLLDTPALEAGQFDSETLWQLVKTQIQTGTRVLIVRGDTPGSDEAAPQGVGRDWLAQRLAAAGAQVDFVVAYLRGAPKWDAQQLALASAAAQDGSVWVLSSAEALTNLRGLLPDQGWSTARAVATHMRIADAARLLGFGQVALASPTLPSVLASLESLA